MITLTEEQFHLIRQYLELVCTVKEAFSYVVTSFDDLSYTEGDIILGDIFAALQQLKGTNNQLEVLFQNHTVVQDTITSFSDILQQLSELETVWDDVEARQQLIREDLSPTYATWSQEITNLLQPMTIS